MSWNELSMADKANVMKLAIESGIYDLDTIREEYNKFAEGGSIHIKPSHRGRLTELKKRTGKSEAELYNDGNPAHKKMVVFARNARKWKHGDGGSLFNTIKRAKRNAVKRIAEETYNLYATLPARTIKKARDYAIAEKLIDKTNSIKPSYIGGTKIETRNKYLEQEPVIAHAIDSIASRYQINPRALKQRLYAEGFIDGSIERRNNEVLLKTSPVRGYDLLHEAVKDNKYPVWSTSEKRFTTAPGVTIGGGWFGLDDTPSYIRNDQVRPINEKWYDAPPFLNEQNRMVYPATGETIADNMGLTAATYKWFRKAAEKDFPRLPKLELDRYGLAYYNRGIEGGRTWAKNGAVGYNLPK